MRRICALPFLVAPTLGQGNVDGVLELIELHVKPTSPASVRCYEALNRPEARLHRSYSFELPEALQPTFTGVILDPDYEGLFSLAHEQSTPSELTISLQDLGGDHTPVPLVGGDILFSLTFSSVPQGTHSVQFVGASHTDLANQPVSSIFDPAVGSLISAPLSVFPEELVAVERGRYSSSYLQAPAAVGTVTWEVIGGALPQGLHLSTKGKLSGKVATSVSEGTYTFTARAIDSEGSQASREYDLEVTDLGPMITSVLFRDNDSNNVVSAGDALDVNFTEDIQIGASWSNALYLLRPGDSFGNDAQASVSDYKLTVTLGSGCLLGSLGGRSGIGIFASVNDGIEDTTGLSARAGRKLIRQPIQNEGLGTLQLGQAIDPITLFSPPFLPREFVVVDLPEGLEYSYSPMEGGVISGTPTELGADIAALIEVFNRDGSTKTHRWSFEVVEEETSGPFVMDILHDGPIYAGSRVFVNIGDAMPGVQTGCAIGSVPLHIAAGYGEPNRCLFIVPPAATGGDLVVTHGDLLESYGPVQVLPDPNPHGALEFIAEMELVAPLDSGFGLWIRGGGFGESPIVHVGDHPAPVLYSNTSCVYAHLPSEEYALGQPVLVTVQAQEDNDGDSKDLPRRGLLVDTDDPDLTERIHDWC